MFKLIHRGYDINRAAIVDVAEEVSESVPFHLRRDDTVISNECAREIAGWYSSMEDDDGILFTSFATTGYVYLEFIQLLEAMIASEDNEVPDFLEYTDPDQKVTYRDCLVALLTHILTYDFDGWTITYNRESHDTPWQTTSPVTGQTFRADWIGGIASELPRVLSDEEIDYIGRGLTF